METIAESGKHISSVQIMWPSDFPPNKTIAKRELHDEKLLDDRKGRACGSWGKEQKCMQVSGGGVGAEGRRVLGWIILNGKLMK
jgi:hypothetical protein